jgi:hypothetical protein
LSLFNDYCTLGFEEPSEAGRTPDLPWLFCTEAGHRPSFLGIHSKLTGRNALTTEGTGTREESEQQSGKFPPVYFH